MRGRASSSSASRCVRQFAISRRLGSRFRPRSSRGLHRTRLVIKTRRIAALRIIRRSKSPERSPLNVIPVRSPPKRPGAIPTNATVAGAAPWPGTTRERHRTSAGHRSHPRIAARNASSAPRRDGLGRFGTLALVFTGAALTRSATCWSKSRSDLSRFAAASRPHRGPARIRGRGVRRSSGDASFAYDDLRGAAALGEQPDAVSRAD